MNEFAKCIAKDATSKLIVRVFSSIGVVTEIYNGVSAVMKDDVSYYIVKKGEPTKDYPIANFSVDVQRGGE